MAEELVAGCWWLDLGGTNAYLVEDGDDLVLVDAGMPWHADDVRAGVRDAGYDLADVTRVFVTHYDIDHVGGLRSLDLDAPVHVGAKDADFLTGRRRPPLSNRKGLFQRVTGLLAPTLTDVAYVADGDEIGSFTAFATPGHTPGHVAYVSRERGVAFLGDLVREADGALEPSPWALSYDTGDVRESIASLVRESPAFDVACVGHGTPLVTGGKKALAGALG
ncbi:MBL fold metallo-hydrolase [Halarchaeum sp. CBA1220]|uniref:MBL fold metallo-hydrolase n=1 Tax=Halarchaeum sp. CBA1220 TaxID=1853682 RepID=UPI000F3A98F0|nr:MBL fold metallo-hydrolase [Halarchaeum sp. CBA1220]QLC32819.1 MBL fold metallo-hydrolase [Halarchaeum sp. CBA1220]